MKVSVINMRIESRRPPFSPDVIPIKDPNNIMNPGALTIPDKWEEV